MGNESSAHQEDNHARSNPPSEPPSENVLVSEASEEDSSRKTQPEPHSRVRRQRFRPDIESLLGHTLVNAKWEAVSPKIFSVENGVLALYFAAHWCTPCRSFCPKLMRLYEELHQTGRAFEVIYVGLDNNETAFNEYFTKMPWFAIPFNEEDKRDELADRFDVQGIPVLVLLDASTLEVIAMDGREIVCADPHGAFFPWKGFSISDPEVPLAGVSSSVDANKAPQEEVSVKESHLRPA